MIIAARAKRFIRINNREYQEGEEIALPINQFRDLGPEGADVVEEASPAEEPEAVKKPSTKKEA